MDGTLFLSFIFYYHCCCYCCQMTHTHIWVLLWYFYFFFLSFFLISTCVAGALANKLKLQWKTKEGIHHANYWGSLMMASTIKLGSTTSASSASASLAAGAASTTAKDIYVPIHSMLPMTHPNDIVWGGWDINDMNLGDAMERSKVLDVQLQEQLYPHMKDIVPLPSIYVPDFIAANQSKRANNTLGGSKQEQMEIIQQNIIDFRKDNHLDQVIVVWTANTERFASVEEGINDTAENLLASIARDEEEISASTMFAVASILTNCTFINGSPQNTFVPGVIELAQQHNVFLAGDDFKSGQTKVKSVLVDFLVSAGIKPVSIVSYNHLGNNDGKNLSAPNQFRSKEISKSNVVDDMVASNPILFGNGTGTSSSLSSSQENQQQRQQHVNNKEHPDHVVVIKYVPYVGDSKRAMDEYTNEIFMGGTNTMVLHNTCEDSLLATPLIYDLVILAELLSRIRMRAKQNNNNNDNGNRQPTALPTDSNNNHDVRQSNGNSQDKMDTNNNDTTNNKNDDDDGWESFHPILSLLSYMLKAPLVPNGSPVINALFPQRQAIINVLRACLGLPPENFMTLEHRLMMPTRTTSSSSTTATSSTSTTTTLPLAIECVNPKKIKNVIMKRDGTTTTTMANNEPPNKKVRST